MTRWYIQNGSNLYLERLREEKRSNGALPAQLWKDKIS